MACTVAAATPVMVDGALLGSEGSQDVGCRLLEDLRVLEDRPECGEAGDGQEGGAGHRGRRRAVAGAARSRGDGGVFAGGGEG
jgi:hypothetical protein